MRARIEGCRCRRLVRGPCACGRCRILRQRLEPVVIGLGWVEASNVDLDGVIAPRCGGLVALRNDVRELLVGGDLPVDIDLLTKTRTWSASLEGVTRVQMRTDSGRRIPGCHSVGEHVVAAGGSKGGRHECGFRSGRTPAPAAPTPFRNVRLSTDGEIHAGPFSSCGSSRRSALSADRRDDLLRWSIRSHGDRGLGRRISTHVASEAAAASGIPRLLVARTRSRRAGRLVNMPSTPSAMSAFISFAVVNRVRVDAETAVVGCLDQARRRR